MSRLINVKLQGNYNPEHFMNKYAGCKCTVHNCFKGTEKVTTVDHFFSTFGLQCPENANILKLKVGDFSLSINTPF